MFDAFMNLTGNGVCASPAGQQLQAQDKGCSTGNHPGKVVRVGIPVAEMEVNFFYKTKCNRCKRCSDDAKRRCNSRAGQAGKKMDYFLFSGTWLIRFHALIISSQPA